MAKNRAEPSPRRPPFPLSLPLSPSRPPSDVLLVGEFEDYSVNVIGDGIAPVITLNGAANMSFEQWYQFVEPGFTASDDISGNLTSSVSV